ncbi:MAG: DUF4082 domain-containing protein [Luteolibacter sp.]
MLIQGNKVYGNEGMIPWRQVNGFSDGNGIIVDTNQLTKSDYNFSNAPDYAGRTLVQNNLAYNNGGSGIHSFQSSHVDIVHNIAYRNSASPRLTYSQIFAGYSTDVRMMNNILVAPNNPTGNTSFNEPITSNGSNTAGTIYYQNNVFYGEGNNQAIPTNANFTNNLTSNPLFLSASTDPLTNDFHLHTASQASNSGLSIAYRSAFDLDGRPRLTTNTTPDRGAYQQQPGDVYAPVFTPQPGIFASAQAVTLTSDTASVTIAYTTDGTAPVISNTGIVTNGVTYAGAFTVSTASTVKAIAWKSGSPLSNISTATYAFNPTAATIPTPYFDVWPTTTDGTQYVSVICGTPGATVRYTTDGTAPSTTNGTIASSAAIAVTSANKVRAIAYKTGRTTSAELAGNYVIRPSYGSMSQGTAAENFGAGKIRFSRFQATTNITATRILAKVGAISGSYRVAIYGETKAAPGLPGTFLKASATALTNPTAGWQSFALTSGQALASGSNYWLAIWSDNPSASIYYDTTGGTLLEMGSTFSTTWPTSITTNAPPNSAYKYAIFATTNYTPVMNAGVDQNVSISSGATLAGTATFSNVPLLASTLTTGWSKVSGPGTVTFGTAAALTSTATFSAAGTYALRLTGLDNLFNMYAPATDDIVVTVQSPSPAPTPVFTPPAGTYTSAQTVTLTSTAGATIHYTTNNTAPTSTSPSVANGGTVTLNATATLRAYATAAGYLDSAEASGVYTISIPPPPSGQALFGTGTPTGTATIGTPANPSNLLLNPGFENAFTSWGPFSMITPPDGASVHSGSFSARPSKASAGVFQSVTLTRNATYVFSAWGNKSKATDNSWLSYTPTGGAEITVNFANVIGWQRVSTTYTVPAGAGATLAVQNGAWFSGGSTGTMAFDDFSLYETIPIVGTELGTRFSSNAYGEVTALRVWHPVGGPSSYNLTLWNSSGTALATATGTAGAGAGWVEASLATPVSVSENDSFVVSYSVPAGGIYQATPGGLNTSVVSGPIFTVVGNNGVFAASSGVFPALSNGNTNYWTDVRMNPLSSPTAPSDVVRARFTDGTGTTAPQQFSGSLGDGWVAGWGVSSAAAGTAALVSPLKPATNTYLQVARTGGTTSQEGVWRQWSTTTRPDNQFARLTFDVRLDSSTAVFDTVYDNLSICSRSASGASIGNDAAFFIRAYGAATGPLQAREWGVFNGDPGQVNGFDVNRFLPTGMIIQPGVTYTFTIDLYGADAGGNSEGRIHGTYDVTISNGTSSVKINGAGFRSAAYNSGPYFSFSTQQSNIADNLTFSLDSIEMTSLTPVTLSPIAIWRADNFRPADLADPSLEATIWGHSADPDNDSLNNLLEYALDIDPLNAATNGLPEVSTDINGVLTLSFLRARDDVSYTVDASSDLIHWTLLAEDPGAVGEVVSVQDVPPDSSASRFMRLKVTK